MAKRISEDRRRIWVTDVLLLAVAVVWGTSYGTAKEALNYYPVLGFLAVRFLLTFLVLSPILLRLPRVDLLKLVRVGGPTGAILLSVFLCETFGVYLTTASNAALLISLCVIFTPFVEWLLLGCRPRRRVFLAALVSLGGTWMLTGGANVAVLNAGDLLIIGAAVLRACMVTVTRRMTEGLTVSSLSLTAMQAGVVGVGSLLVALSVLPLQAIALPDSATFWACTVYLVLFCTVFAFFAQNYAVRRSSPTRVAVLMGSEPLFGALFAVMFVGEQLSALAWFGGGLICAATLWVALAPHGVDDNKAPADVRPMVAGQRLAVESTDSSLKGR
ncbi:DMT family transporter [Pseudothauera rhizosphaerae]|uniref:EamA family transporter n=1 Tax=Pseudothauera rhizosphaerae TaxID=2565932 RepID=A0A4S4ABB1_9RHOO|nr:EamA family transporter [Pseudothauera rhizosphaerae]THF56238.1 EamA family transporter [Pseudothauera rhizosphaerae]